MAKVAKGATKRVGMALSRAMRYSDRAAFIFFAKHATIGHWAEVIDIMEAELRREGRDPATGDPAFHPIPVPRSHGGAE